MKLIHGILGCALAAGLTIFAAAPAQAGIVIDGVLYTPFDIKLQVQYNDSKGNVREATVTTKDLLKLLGDEGDKLATDYEGFGGSAHVFVIHGNSIVEDLTSEDIFSLEFNDLVIKQDKSGKNGTFAESEKGIISMSFGLTNNIEPTVARGEAPSVEYDFEITGVYTWQDSGGAVKDGEQKISTQLLSTGFSGDGFDSSLSPAPDVKAHTEGGDGDFLIKRGTVVGTGSGTVDTGG